MYHLILSSPGYQVWQSSNGWRVTVVNGKFGSRRRQPMEHSKRFLAYIP